MTNENSKPDLFDMHSQSMEMVESVANMLLKQMEIRRKTLAVKKATEEAFSLDDNESVVQISKVRIEVQTGEHDKEQSDFLLGLIETMSETVRQEVELYNLLSKK